MIGYKMGLSLVMVYTTTKTSPLEKIEHERKYDMVVNMATFFAKRIFQRSSLGQP